MVTAVHDITQTIANINGITTSIAGAVEQQNAATAQISESLERASSGTGQVTAACREMPKTAAETGRSPNGSTCWRRILPPMPTACSARSIRC